MTIGTTLAGLLRTMRPRRSLASALIVLATTSGGCSLAFVNGPPAAHKKMTFFGCTSSNAVPMVDTGLAALLALDAVGLGTDSNTGATNRTSDEIGLGLMAAALGVSAAYGFHETARCRDAQLDLLQRTPPGPVFIPPPPPPAYDPWVAHPVAPAPAAPSTWESGSPAAGAPESPGIPPPAPAPSAPSAPPPSPPSPWEAAPPAK
jgi:hypothetical protein